jgi:Na+/melibiose symporter-like transporter
MAAFGFVRSSDEDESPEQPRAVVLLLSFCFSIVPAVFILFGAIALCWYPQAARSEQAHVEVVDAIRKKHKRGLSAEDPWNPGRILPPPPACGAHHGLLSYFTPGELLHAVGGKAEVAMWSRQGEQADQRLEFVDYWSLIKSAFKYLIVAGILSVVGTVLLVRGFDELNNDLGASSSPIGLIFLGVAVLLAWFHGTRVKAALKVSELKIPKLDFVLQYNYLCRFTSEFPLPIGSKNPRESHSPYKSDMIEIKEEDEASRLESIVQARVEAVLKARVASPRAKQAKQLNN